MRCALPHPHISLAHLAVSYAPELNGKVFSPFSCSGDPDKCDLTGNTALHWAASKGHMNCVSFLVNFGVNLWSLNNDYQTAKDAVAPGDQEVLDFMDTMVAKQSALNPKLVQKAKEKAVVDVEKRLKSFDKLTKKATKRAEREEKGLEKTRKKFTSESLSIGSVLRRDSLASVQLFESKVNQASQKFSDIVSTTGTMTKSKVRGFGAVSRRIAARKGNSNFADTVSIAGSLGRSKHAKIHSFNTTNLIRTTSEPDFVTLMHRTDSGLGDDVHVTPPQSSIFERPGFGSMAFRHNSRVAAQIASERDDQLSDLVTSHRPTNGSGSDSIGSAGSLAHRNGTLSVISGHSTPWEEEDEGLDDIDLADLEGGHHIKARSTPAMVLFLAAHGLSEYVELFAEEKIDLEALILLNDTDLKDLGLPLGPRKKLMSAIQKRKIRLSEPGLLRDTDL